MARAPLSAAAVTTLPMHPDPGAHADEVEVLPAVAASPGRSPYVRETLNCSARFPLAPSAGSAHASNFNFRRCGVPPARARGPLPPHPDDARSERRHRSSNPPVASPSAAFCTGFVKKPRIQLSRPGNRLPFVRPVQASCFRVRAPAESPRGSLQGFPKNRTTPRHSTRRARRNRIHQISPDSQIAYAAARFPPFLPTICFAASCTASTIFVYPVHRQRLPARARRMSSSEGEGFFRRSP